ncbi:hypothetical protein HMPREF0293_1906 [Corynebacterium glucuronolyticum ATCC 51866]|uniref:Uncharacterized protein n=1 Tax=Corynebacterium glucuronolyticum ATCC 51866 TaxID=548478 RepID=A0ABP2DRX2_9CORY|nr:hypothetical protein HMPREF0293_1906 [Corynebacterium glucuronolyticum ATCC 51866]
MMSPEVGPGDFVVFHVVSVVEQESVWAAGTRIVIPPATR